MTDAAGVVKWLTRRIVAPLCVGSTPTTRPIFFTQIYTVCRRGSIFHNGGIAKR